MSEDDNRREGAAPGSAGAEDPWTELQRFPSLMEASLAKSFLEAQGLAVQIPDEHMARNYSFATTFLGNIRVLVRESQLSEARSLMAEVERSQLRVAEEGRGAGPNSTEEYRSRFAGWRKWVTVFLLAWVLFTLLRRFF